MPSQRAAASRERWFSSCTSVSKRTTSSGLTADARLPHAHGFAEVRVASGEAAAEERRRERPMPPARLLLIDDDAQLIPATRYGFPAGERRVDRRPALLLGRASRRGRQCTRLTRWLSGKGVLSGWVKTMPVCHRTYSIAI